MAANQKPSRYFCLEFPTENAKALCWEPLFHGFTCIHHSSAFLLTVLDIKSKRETLTSASLLLFLFCFQGIRSFERKTESKILFDLGKIITVKIESS